MLLSTLNAFKSKNFRLYFVGQSLSLVGTWMQKTAVNWVVYSLTNSQLMLGISLFASLFPSFLFSFLGGVIADRYNRMHILLITQIASFLQALILAIIVGTGHYNVSVIIILSAALGLISWTCLISGWRK